MIFDKVHLCALLLSLTGSCAIFGKCEPTRHELPSPYGVISWNEGCDLENEVSLYISGDSDVIGVFDSENDGLVDLVEIRKKKRIIHRVILDLFRSDSSIESVDFIRKYQPYLNQGDEILNYWEKHHKEANSQSLNE